METSVGLTVRLIVFGITTLLLLYWSRTWLRNPRSHGFFRFFVFEAIVALVLLNIPHWFRDGLSWRQLVSWLLLFTSFVPLILGVAALRSRGQPDRSSRPDPQLIGFERTTRLVSDGIFRYIRHPMYCSLLLLAWGLFFKDVSVASALLVMAASVLLVLTAKRDEAECLEVFGREYQDYMKRTTMFLPYIL